MRDVNIGGSWVRETEIPCIIFQLSSEPELVQNKRVKENFLPKI